MKAGRAPLLVVLLLAAASCAKESDDNAVEGALSGPQPNADHWHTAFGIYVCDEFLPDLPVSQSPVGLHTHGDGVVHIHPFSNQGAGANATVDRFLADTDVTLDEGALDVDGESYADGDDCGGDPGVVQVAWWDDADNVDEPPSVTTDGLDELLFTGDQQAFTIAFVPEGAEIPPPTTSDALDELGAVDSSGPTDTTLPGTTDPGPAGTVDLAPASLDDGFYPVVAMLPDDDPACSSTDDVLADSDGNCYALSPDGLDTDIVESAEAEIPSGIWQVSLVLTDDGIDQFNDLASLCFTASPDCPSRQVAIVVDGSVVSAPSIQEPSFDKDAISIVGDFDEDKAKAVADALDG